MPTETPPKPPPLPPRPADVPAAFLGYLVPGLGHIYQGRVGKGILFMVCLYLLFFYGMYLGHGKNVYIPNEKDLPRIHLLGRDRFPLPDAFNAIGYRVQFLGQFWMGIVVWPAILQYNSEQPVSFLGEFQRNPGESRLMELQTNGDKTWDLGWVYTVIAGVLNIMVIYDALAGPAFVPDPRAKTTKEASAPHAAPAAAGS